MKYRLPPGCAAVSHAGKSLEVASDACIDADPAAITLLASHGIVPARGSDANTAEAKAAETAGAPSRGEVSGGSSGRRGP